MKSSLSLSILLLLIIAACSPVEQQPPASSTTIDLTGTSSATALPSGTNTRQPTSIPDQQTAIQLTTQVVIEPGARDCRKVISIEPTSQEGQAVLSAVLAYHLETKVGELFPETPLEIDEVRSIIQQGEWVLVQASFSAYLEPGIFLFKRTSQGFEYDRLLWGGQADSPTELSQQMVEENPDVPSDLIACFPVAGWFVPAQTPSISRSPTSPPASARTPQPTDTSTPEPSLTRTVKTETPGPTPMVTPTIGPIGQVQLGVYELVMAYKTNRWQEDEADELGHKALTHTIFPNCRIEEYGPGHILGDFQYRLGLGQHLFSMYEYIEEREDEATLRREYVIEGRAPAPSQTAEPTPVAKPAFLVTAPASNPEDCIVSVHVVLATLHEPPDQ